MTALYWAVATMTSVGYGDVSAVNDLERIVSIVWMILGATIFSNLMSGISAILEGLGTSQAQIAAEKENIVEFLKTRKVCKLRATTVKYQHGSKRIRRQRYLGIFQHICAVLT